jgi:hypothetical protein
MEEEEKKKRRRRLNHPAKEENELKSNAICLYIWNTPTGRDQARRFKL